MVFASRWLKMCPGKLTQFSLKGLHLRKANSCPFSLRVNGSKEREERKERVDRAGRPTPDGHTDINRSSFSQRERGPIVATDCGKLYLA